MVSRASTTAPSRMSQRKQTARKTTGIHSFYSNVHVRGAPRASRPRSQPKRRPIPASVTSSSGNHELPRDTSTAGMTSLCTKLSSPMPQILPSPLAEAPVPRTVDTSSDDDSLFLLSRPQRFKGTANSAPGTLTAWRRPVVHVLDKPISVCVRFATWLETQTCVHGDILVCAVERDGRHFLALAEATLAFDRALRGGGVASGGPVPLPPLPNANGDAPANPLGEHARTLRAFAEHLAFKISEGTLGTELETAVLRDGEALLRLALCCLEVDQAIRGSGGAVSS